KLAGGNCPEADPDADTNDDNSEDGTGDHHVEFIFAFAEAENRRLVGCTPRVT
ncbi:MAG: hypothetical protein J07HN4v3_01792, partial [Halonotius sp. J07HN4]